MRIVIVGVLLVLSAVGFGSQVTKIDVAQPAQAAFSCPGGSTPCSGGYCADQCKSYLQCQDNGTFRAVCGQCGYDCTTPLTVSNVAVPTKTSTSATVTWTTNKPADGKVNYGLAAGSYSQSATPPPGTLDSTSHSITLVGLNAGTTYHFQVESKTSPDVGSPQTARSAGDQTFATPTGEPVGSAPTLTFGPRHDVTSDRAVITFRTNVATASLIEYNVNPDTDPTPGLPGYTQACNDAANCPPLPAGQTPPWPNVVVTDHRIILTGLTTPQREYRYKITVVDSARNSFATSVFKFSTSSSSTDHIFSTGDCDDGTPLRQCNADGKYCRPGGGQPVYDCRPDIQCPHTCPASYTCQESGDCSKDPTLGDSPTLCNQKSCYQKCDRGPSAGQRCLGDGDCGAGNKCIVGSFTIPAGLGCYASWPQCNANVVLKVRPDRECDKWLTCKTSFETRTAAGKKVNQCTDLTVCDSLSPNGQCNGLLEGRQCSNDPLRFCTKDSDCIGPTAFCEPPGTKLPLTYDSPEDVKSIQSFSGYGQAGIRLHDQPGSPLVPPGGGLYPLALAEQVGARIDLPDGDFEQTAIIQRCSGDKTISCDQNDVVDKCVGKGKCIVTVVSDQIIAKYWEAVTPIGSTGTAVAQDFYESGKSVNRSLKITPTNLEGSGGRTTLTAGLVTSKSSKYFLLLRMRSEENAQPVRISLTNDTGDASLFRVQPLTTGWLPLLLGPIDGVGGPTHLSFTTTVTGDPVSFWLDDISMLPALKVSDSIYIPQSCRLYPNEGSPACDYVDRNGVSFRGLKGYCLERDPRNSAICLSWWPVDVVSGDSTFGQEQNAGYSGRQPLYACAESAGNYNKYGDRLFASGYNAGYRAQSVHESGCESDRDCGNADTNYTFCVCDDISATTSIIAGPTAGIPESAIRSVEIKKVQSPGQGPANLVFINEPTFQERTEQVTAVNSYKYTRDVNGDGTVEWHVGDTVCPVPGSGAIDCLDVWLLFDANHQFTTYQYAINDQTGGKNEASAYQVIFNLREQCTKLVQVATDSGVTAWTDRTAGSSTYVVPELNYRYVTDFAPYGTAAPPSNVDKPNDWADGSLDVEGPDVNGFPPYQSRAGQPYACKDGCSSRVCSADSGSKAGENCFDSGDCIDSSTSPVTLGTCVGAGVCLEYNAASKSYNSGTSSKRNCTTNAGCPDNGNFKNEECVGGAASGRGAQTFSAVEPGLANQSYAQYHLMRLFAKAYSLWQWNELGNQYEQQSFTSWLPPAKLCKVCSSGANPNQACTIGGNSCGSGGTCVDATRHPAQNAPGETTADYCAIKPILANVSGVDPTTGQPKPVSLDAGNSYVLKFNSNVDVEQRPLYAVRIDWGDGSVSEELNLRMNPKDDPNNPHAYSHVYNCPQAGRCDYPIRLQIEDNWGWCDNGTNSDKCLADRSTWADGPIIQVLP